MGHRFGFPQGDDEDEETDELIGAVLDEIGISTSTALGGPMPLNVPAAQQQQQAAEAPEDDLQARLDALRRS